MGAGEDFVISNTERLCDAASASGDHVQFYAAVIAALYGHISSALGAETATTMFDALRPLLAKTGQQLDRERAH
jgi:hypothetical protein